MREMKKPEEKAEIGLWMKWIVEVLEGETLNMPWLNLNGIWTALLTTEANPIIVELRENN